MTADAVPCAQRDALPRLTITTRRRFRSPAQSTATSVRYQDRSLISGSGKCSVLRRPAASVRLAESTSDQTRCGNVARSVGATVTARANIHRTSTSSSIARGTDFHLGGVSAQAQTAIRCRPICRERECLCGGGRALVRRDTVPKIEKGRRDLLRRQVRPPTMGPSMLVVRSTCQRSRMFLSARAESRKLVWMREWSAKFAQPGREACNAGPLDREKPCCVAADYRLCGP
jgi:hypothetical protein